MAVDVSVAVLTYNQEKTIARTLDSILNQRHTCTFEIIIGDDSSTDDTRKICEEYAAKYPNIIKINAPHPNYGVVLNHEETLSRCTGKYRMGCAGDDYWSNPNKMQMQYDYMEGHPNCVVCHGGFTEYYEATGVSIVKTPEKIIGNQFAYLLKTNPICAPTACIRMSALRKINVHHFIEQGFLVEDWPKWLALSKYGTIDSTDESLVTYCIAYGTLHNNKKFDTRKKYLDNFLKMRLYYAKEYGCLDKYESSIFDYYHLSVAYAAIKYGERNIALDQFNKLNKKNLKIWVKMIICSIPFLFNKMNAVKNKNM